MSEVRELGVKEVAHRIHLRLRRYLEAQYHIRNSGLIEERGLLLDESGGISQRPFVEVTPSYEVAGAFDALKIPQVVSGLLQELQSWEVGVFPPYRHQAEALERFFAGDGSSDLIVASGTGSGKTETFLYSILGNLALEGSHRQRSFALPGVRALLLYPMNALVSDQTARLRKLLGDPRVSDLFQTRWRRRPRFGMYTSRTPYPGVRKSSKDHRHLAALLSYYVGLETSGRAEDATLVAELRKRGRWPAKDIIRFFAKDLEEKGTFKTGKKAGKERITRNYSQRFRTQPHDRELLSRHEMHAHAPDLLITNYSMLEYMLLRPIERPIFTQTKEWLASDPSNQLLLVLDEAHMYRGVGGAEVGLLIRRLQSRLGIGRDRLRCILTSASLGSDAKAELAAKNFASGLTGEVAGRDFAVIRGTPEPRSGAQTGTTAELAALSAVSPSALAAVRVDVESAQRTLDDVAAALSWGGVPKIAASELAARQFICAKLKGVGPLELLIETCAGKGTAFADLAQKLFPNAPHEQAERATDGLLALGNFARRVEPGRQDQPLLPTRVHLMFRGLPPLYVCINPECTSRRGGNEKSIAGCLFTEPRTRCPCGGRVFELLTHRDCGAAFIRAFATSPNANFFWHERGGKLTEFGKPLHEVHLLLDEPHPAQGGSITPMALDVRTGRVVPFNAKTGRDCYRATAPVGEERNLSTFGVCPACTRRTRSGGSGRSGGALKIMDLATKGEQPFANLVREQFVTQLATKPASAQHPNGGRKALLFSDGRQKAARLARDLPREVERDSFREALVLAVRALESLAPPIEATLDEKLYVAFLSVCSHSHLHFFDGPDQEALLEHLGLFKQDYADDVQLAFDADWKPNAPTRFRQALTRQLGDPYYSLIAACAAIVEPRPQKLRVLAARIKPPVSTESLGDIAAAWIREMLLKSAFDPALGREARLDEFAYFRAIRPDDGLEQFFGDLQGRSKIQETTFALIRQGLFDIFTDEGSNDSGRLLKPDCLVLKLALSQTWLQCLACGHLQLKPLFGSCGNCSDRRLEERGPNHPYMAARKGFFREPLNAVLAGTPPVHITAEEHTAQLSQRDAGVVYATTEEFELRFQDVTLGPKKPPVDVLSCTTTMEVGIDIGSLTAVGLRTVPPQRENYQQRAGRAGRRGTSVSSVVTYAQGGAHDAHYFANPQTIISGPPREPRIKSDNARLARRHINAHLLQTFFHEQLDEMSELEKELESSRPGVMSAFGTTREFFRSDDSLSFAAFDRWITSKVLTAKSDLVEKIAAWLPSALAPGPGSLDARRALTRDVAARFRSDLSVVRADFADAATPPVVEGTEDDADAEDDNEATVEDEGVLLLDTLFDRGLLPAYAFPTDLCSFVIQKWGKKDRVEVAERPQQGKAQALSEYAPGRLLVVNKKTYRVGGIFVEGPPTASPAVSLFSAPLKRYVGCPRCSFVRIEEGASAKRTEEGAPCPVCDTPLLVREYLDPPGFSAEGGRALGEGDREQELTYASAAQLPELVERADFAWKDGPGTMCRHAYGEDVLLVVANKGQDGGGFSICESCGASWLDGEEELGPHARPFLLPSFIRSKEGAAPRCEGSVRRGVFLAHEFLTDILLLRTAIKAPLDFSPDQPWLYDALATLSEALALAASLHLDIDPGELSAGFRLLPEDVDGGGRAEIFLYDTASGGAGYAADAGEDLNEVLDVAARLLSSCPGGCQRSCSKCLRHYGNRFLHSRLDRRLGLTILNYLRSSAVPEAEKAAEQRAILAPLADLLALEGWRLEKDAAEGRPLVATSPSGRAVIVGVYPALMSADAATEALALRPRAGEEAIVLPDYLVERDLPSAYQVVAGIPRPTLRVRRATGGQRQAPSEPTVHLPFRDLRTVATKQDATIGRVGLRLATVPPADAFAARVPSDALARAGFRPGRWVVLRPVQPGEQLRDAWALVVRAKGTFRATSESWTIARIKVMDDDSGRIQLSYNATAKQFDPERVEATSVVVAAIMLERDLEGD